MTRQPLDGMFRPALTLRALGEMLELPASLDDALSSAVCEQARREGVACVRGDTVSAETFYLAQGRCDGAFGCLSGEGRLKKLRECRERGVRNIEMEALVVAAFAERVGVPAAVVCMVLVDRLVGETPVEEDGILVQSLENAVAVVVAFVKEHLEKGTVWGR